MWGRFVVVVAALGLLTCPVARAAAAPYGGPFVDTAAPASFGQAPVFMPNGDVVWGDGHQIRTAHLDGSAGACLTCGQPGPNGVPAVRPQGDWILFHSWRGHRITLGSPGYGGLGSALWIMRPDGSHVAELTGTDASKGGGEGEDDYHAYWSPDGRHVVWAHLNWDFLLDRGSGRWDIRVADFVVHAGVPALVNERVVRPANGHWYETQWWAPDGSGFLYTETYGTAMNTELFFCRLTAAGCTVTRLTDNPGWDEQAIFTPDGKNVIWMSSRDHPGVFNTFSTLAQDAGLTTDEDYLLTLPVFEAAFEQPVAAEATDLYELNLASGAVRRLTTDGDDGWVTPEFTWDPTHRFLLWTELRIADGVRAPLPVDAIRQLKQLAAYLSHPSVPNVGGGNLLGALVPLESRTREGRFR